MIFNGCKWTALILGITLLTACSAEERSPVRRTQFIMGTLVEITVSHADEKVANLAMTQAFDEMRRIEKLMSTYLLDSEISQLNRSAGGAALALSPEVVEVLREAVRWGEASAGAFDVTIEPVARLWNFDEEEPQAPEPERLQRALTRINYRDIEIENDRVRLAQPGMAINLGAIAKGYAVDRAAALLRGLVPNGIINAGGDLTAFGRRNPEDPWIIGLQHPRAPNKVLASFAVEKRGVATSGDYQKYFIRDGVRYHHILNPTTGLPARGLTSVTVIAPSVMQADALATAAFVMGPEKGLAWLDSLPEVEALVVLADGKLRFTNGFQKQPQFSLR